MARRPNFFILGAPKCGTTALSAYLRDHPRVFVSQPKEPHYFCGDFDYYYAPGERSEEHYLRLFEEATDGHVAVGEASVWYLYSSDAARNIAAFDPASRVVVMLRNPVELVPSLHSQLLYMLDEDEPDPESAWDLQEARARGERVPARARVPAFLQYGEAARLGAQLRRVYDALPREQVLTIVFDDLRRDTGAVYRRTLDFLGLPDDGRAHFPRVNENKVHRAESVARLTQRPPPALVSVARGVKRVAGVERLGVLERVRRRNREVARRPETDPAFVARLREHFRDDVAELGDLIGRDLRGWVS